MTKIKIPAAYVLLLVFIRNATFAAFPPMILVKISRRRGAGGDSKKKDLMARARRDVWIPPKNSDVIYE